MGIEKEKLDPTPTLLLGFVENKVLPKRSIILQVIARDTLKQSTVMVKFLMVKFHSVYNMIAGRPSLNNMKIITSTYHLDMKFSTEYGVGVVRGD